MMMDSRAAIGTQNFGGAGSPSALIGAGLDEAGAHRTLDAAERLGVTVIDTAFSYAAGRAQDMIGSWLAADPDRSSRMTIVDKQHAAEVVTQNTGADLAAPRAGMGLRFLEMDPQTRTRIDALYERKLAEAAEAVEKEAR